MNACSLYLLTASMKLNIYNTLQIVNTSLFTDRCCIKLCEMFDIKSRLVTNNILQCISELTFWFTKRIKRLQAV